jgi:TRAP-type C4-dicarboxylate transport system permease large subunit
VGIQLLALLMVMLFPQVTLWLPDIMDSMQGF